MWGRVGSLLRGAQDDTPVLTVRGMLVERAVTRGASEATPPVSLATSGGSVRTGLCSRRRGRRERNGLPACDHRGRPSHELLHPVVLIRGERRPTDSRSVRSANSAVAAPPGDRCEALFVPRWAVASNSVTRDGGQRALRTRLLMPPQGSQRVRFVPRFRASRRRNRGGFRRCGERCGAGRPVRCSCDHVQPRLRPRTRGR